MRWLIRLIALLLFVTASAVLYDRWQIDEDWSDLTPTDPLPHTQQLIHANRFAEAEAYLGYFVDHNSSMITSEGRELLHTLHAKRQSWTYKAKAVLDGALSGHGDDMEGMIGAGVADLFVVGDIRDLVIEGSHWMDGEEVDEVIVALSSLGVAASAATVSTAGGAGGIKGSLSLLKSMRKGRLLPAWFLRALSRLPRASSLQKEASALLDPIVDLYHASGYLGARTILAGSKSLKDLETMRFFAKRFGKESAVLLHIDPSAVRLAERFSARTVTRASLYGQPGFKRLAHRLKYTTRVSKYLSKHWQTLLRSIPLWVVWLVWGVSGGWMVLGVLRRVR